MNNASTNNSEVMPKIKILNWLRTLKAIPPNRRPISFHKICIMANVTYATVIHYLKSNYLSPGYQIKLSKALKHLPLPEPIPLKANSREYRKFNPDLQPYRLELTKRIYGMWKNYGFWYMRHKFNIQPAVMGKIKKAQVYPFKPEDIKRLYKQIYHQELDI